MVTPERSGPALFLVRDLEGESSMAEMRFGVAASLVAALMTMSGAALAAPCGNTGAGFEAWKPIFAREAQARGVGPAAISALMNTTYSTGTIRADRGQHSFTLTLDQFMAKRGAPAIAAKGKSMKVANAALFNAIEKRYGVPPGPLVTIWGMETGFGTFMGNQQTLSAVATLAYDCRRTEYFTDQLYAALQLVDRDRNRAGDVACGVLAGGARINDDDVAVSDEAVRDGFDAALHLLAQRAPELADHRFLADITARPGGRARGLPGEIVGHRLGERRGVAVRQFGEDALQQVFVFNGTHGECPLCRCSNNCED
jgi:hypothetical protein